MQAQSEDKNNLQITCTTDKLTTKRMSLINEKILKICMKIQVIVNNFYNKYICVALLYFNKRTGQKKKNKNLTRPVLQSLVN